MRRESFSVAGKWVLAGEHTVLRGGTAVALPHPNFGLELEFSPGTGFEVVPGSAQEVIEALFTVVGLPIPEGTLTLKSTIPVGAGLGSSAALCVAFTRWMAPRMKLPESEVLSFATRLEDHFHGKSSGMDIAAIVAGEPIEFSMKGGPRPLGVKKLPRFTFHDTGVRCRTNLCVEKVERLRTENTGLSVSVDTQMNEACRAVRDGLLAFDHGEEMAGLAQVARGMELGQRCFESWDLVPPEALRIIEGLRREGALACKLTGAGGGGMVVALWPSGG